MTETEITPSTRERFDVCDQVVQRGTKAFLEVGAALYEIRDSRLYLAAFPSFSAYCRERFDALGSRRANQLIAAVTTSQRLASDLPEGTMVPANERQLRELSRVPNDRQSEIWQEALELAEQKGAEVTASLIKRVVDRALEVGDVEEAAPSERRDHFVAYDESVEWYTPTDVTDRAHGLMGDIDLDPASCWNANQTVRARRFYTADEDGYRQPWEGRVFLNPPYGLDEDNRSNQAKWSERAIADYRSGAISEAVLVLNSSTGDQWFRPLWGFALCFPRRLKFRQPNHDGDPAPAKRGQVIVYLGRNIGGFVAQFSGLGQCVVPGVNAAIAVEGADRG